MRVWPIWPAEGPRVGLGKVAAVSAESAEGGRKILWAGKICWKKLRRSKIERDTFHAEMDFRPIAMGVRLSTISWVHKGKNSTYR